jgi:hypothetical protein
MLTAEALLAGPRGRRLCWELVNDALTSGPEPPACWNGVWQAMHAGDLSGRLDDFSVCVARASPVALAADPAAVLPALRRSVGSARYWQEPDAEDQALTPAAVADALRPVAAALADTPASGWWASPMASASQRYAQFLGSGHPFDEPQLSGSARRVAAWRAATVAEEDSARGRPAEPLGAWSGHWWSDPAMSGLPVTTRAASGLGALRLVLVEDTLGWTSARCWPLAPRAGTRVYEVDGPAAWASLAARYPLDLSWSRRHDWWQVTGWTGRWVIPDFQAVAADYDAVHVSVLGYLVTAGRAVPAGPDDGTRTLLAGWDPDATWWLTDSLSLSGPPEEWASEEWASEEWASEEWASEDSRGTGAGWHLAG